VGLADMKNARMLSRALEGTGYYTVISDIHRAVGAREQRSIEDSEIEVRFLTRCVGILLTKWDL